MYSKSNVTASNYDGESDGLGILFSLSQDWKKSMGAGNRLQWSRSMLDNADGEHIADAMNFEAEIGYGFEIRDGHGRMTPFDGVLFDGNGADINLGGCSSFDPDAEFSIEGTRISMGQREPTRKYRIGGKLRMQAELFSVCPAGQFGLEPCKQCLTQEGVTAFELGLPIG